MVEGLARRGKNPIAPWMAPGSRIKSRSISRRMPAAPMARSRAPPAPRFRRRASGRSGRGPARGRVNRKTPERKVHVGQEVRAERDARGSPTTAPGSAPARRRLRRQAGGASAAGAGPETRRPSPATKSSSVAARRRGSHQGRSPRPGEVRHRAGRGRPSCPTRTRRPRREPGEAPASRSETPPRGLRSAWPARQHGYDGERNELAPQAP